MGKQSQSPTMTTDTTEQAAALPAAPEAGAPSAHRQPYTAPRATFVPLRLEERLFASNPLPFAVCETCFN